jgi:hypothetical protein
MKFGNIDPTKVNFGVTSKGGGGEDSKVYCKDICNLTVVFVYEDAKDPRYKGQYNIHANYALRAYEDKSKECTPVDEIPKEELYKSCTYSETSELVIIKPAGMNPPHHDPPEWKYVQFAKCKYTYKLEMVNMGKDRPEPKDRCKDFIVWSDPVAGEEDELLECCQNGTDCEFTVRHLYDPDNPDMPIEDEYEKYHYESACQKSTLCIAEDTDGKDMGTTIGTDSIPSCIGDLLEDLLAVIADTKEGGDYEEWKDECTVPAPGYLGQSGFWTVDEECLQKKVEDGVCSKLKEAIDDFAYECSCKIQGGY